MTTTKCKNGYKDCSICKDCLENQIREFPLIAKDILLSMGYAVSSETAQAKENNAVTGSNEPNETRLYSAVSEFMKVKK